MRKTIVACALVALAVGATTATAAQLITGKQIKNGSITGKDIKRGTVTKKQLSAAVRSASWRSRARPARGPAGPAGPKGDKGEPGAASRAVTGHWGRLQRAIRSVGRSHSCGPGAAEGPDRAQPPRDVRQRSPTATCPRRCTRGDFDGEEADQGIGYLAYTAKYDLARPTSRTSASRSTRTSSSAPNYSSLVYYPNRRCRDRPVGDCDSWSSRTRTGLRYDDDGGDGCRHQRRQGVAPQHFGHARRDHGPTADDSRGRRSAPAVSGGYSNGSTAFADSLELDIDSKRHVSTSSRSTRSWSAPASRRPARPRFACTEGRPEGGPLFVHGQAGACAAPIHCCSRPIVAAVHSARSATYGARAGRGP